MNGKQHLFFATITASATQYVAYEIIPDLTFTTSIAFVVFSGFGALLPDIDLPGTTISKIAGPIPKILYKLIGHRTYTHDFILWSVLLIYLSFCYQNIFIYGLTFGYLGHLFLDSTTAGGIPMLYLFNKKMFHLFPYKWKFKSSSIVSTYVTIIFTAMYSIASYMIVESNLLTLI